MYSHSEWFRGNVNEQIEVDRKRRAEKDKDEEYERVMQWKRGIAEKLKNNSRQVSETNSLQPGRQSEDYLK